MKKQKGPGPSLVIVLFLLTGAISVWTVADFFLNIQLFEASPEEGYHWSFFLYTPSRLQGRAAQGDPMDLLVIPNNTGRSNDDMAIHQRTAWRDLLTGGLLFSSLDTALLVPVFPRPRSHWKIYTHALDRDVLSTTEPELHRLDLQLIAMIETTQAYYAARGWKSNEKVLLWGFSASGMFVNRFTVLHPRRVLAVASGSPGGWPLAPLSHWQGHALRYPIGLLDVEELTGQPVDMEALQQVPQFFFLGDRDTNDSVPYDDGYDDQDEELIFQLFGETPVDRWAICEEIYRSESMDSTFRLYPGIAHRPAGFREVRQFFQEAMRSN